MSRQDITDKGGTQPKSEWFGFKYRVTPESSKLLQEAVFKDGGRWGGRQTTVLYQDEEFIQVTSEGKMWRGFNYFEDIPEPEKQPPQPAKVAPTKKDFIVGKWYKCVEDTSCTHALTNGKYYKCTSSEPTSIGVDSNTMRDSRGWMIERFDINSESDYDPNAKKVVAKDVEESKLDNIVQVTIVRSTETNNFMSSFLTTKEEIDMSNQRKVVEVQLFDDAKGLPVQDSLVAKFENVLTEDDNDTTIREVIMNNDIKKVLAAHNVKRAKVINQDILERTGNSVTLQPVLLKDLRWKVIG